MMYRHEHWVSSNVKTAFAPPRQPNHLDPISKLRSHRNIQGADSRYALPVDRFGIDESSKCERREDGDLVRHIEAFDIISRICLGESKFLRACQRLVETLTARFHRGENVIRLAVRDCLFDRVVDMSNAAGNFDYDFNFCIVDYIAGLIGDSYRTQVHVACFGLIAHGDPLDAEPRVACKQLDDT